MNTMERLLESPEEWEVPLPEHLQTRSHRAKLTERCKIFDEMKVVLDPTLHCTQSTCSLNSTIMLIERLRQRNRQG